MYHELSTYGHIYLFLEDFIGLLVWQSQNVHELVINTDWQLETEEENSMSCHMHFSLAFEFMQVSHGCFMLHFHYKQKEYT